MLCVFCVVCVSRTAVYVRTIVLQALPAYVLVKLQTTNRDQDVCLARWHGLFGLGGFGGDGGGG